MCMYNLKTETQSDDSSTGTIELNKIRYRNCQRDYFTTCMPFPQPDDCSDAMPFFAFQRIWRDYYFNSDVLSDNDFNVFFER